MPLMPDEAMSIGKQKLPSPYCWKYGTTICGWPDDVKLSKDVGFGVVLRITPTASFVVNI